jgi:hypothetical protein
VCYPGVSDTDTERIEHNMESNGEINSREASEHERLATLKSHPPNNTDIEKIPLQIEIPAVSRQPIPLLSPTLPTQPIRHAPIPDNRLLSDDHNGSSGFSEQKIPEVTKENHDVALPVKTPDAHLLSQPDVIATMPPPSTT